MIRDEFKDKKRATTKEARKIALMGERNYYAHRARTLQDFNTALNATNKFLIIVLSLLYVILLGIYIIMLGAETPYSTVKFIIWTALYVAFMIWAILWFTVIKKRNIKEAERCKKELERLSRESLSKIGNAYKFYGKAYASGAIKASEEGAESSARVQNAEENSNNSSEN